MTVLDRREVARKRETTDDKMSEHRSSSSSSLASLSTSNQNGGSDGNAGGGGGGGGGASSMIRPRYPLMAADKTSLRSRAELVRPHLTCRLCYRPLRAAVVLTSCRHRFCGACIEDYVVRRSRRCPLCWSIIGPAGQRGFRADLHVDRMVEAFGLHGEQGVEPVYFSSDDERNGGVEEDDDEEEVTSSSDDEREDTRRSGGEASRRKVSTRQGAKMAEAMRVDDDAQVSTSELRLWSERGRLVRGRCVVLYPDAALDERKDETSKKSPSASAAWPTLRLRVQLDCMVGHLERYLLARLTAARGWTPAVRNKARAALWLPMAQPTGAELTLLTCRLDDAPQHSSPHAQQQQQQHGGRLKQLAARQTKLAPDSRFLVWDRHAAALDATQPVAELRGVLQQQTDCLNLPLALVYSVHVASS